MYGIYGNIYHQYTPNVSIYTIHGSYGIYIHGIAGKWGMLGRYHLMRNVMMNQLILLPIFKRKKRVIYEFIGSIPLSLCAHDISSIVGL